MTCRITVWTPLTEDDDATTASAVVRGLDGQTLPVGEWELVLEAAPGPYVEALQPLAAHRPNVRVVERAGEARMEARGEWVLVLSPDDRLQPAALGELTRLVGEAGDRDMLTVRAGGLGRGASGRGAPGSPLVLTRARARSRHAVDDSSPELVVDTALRAEPAPGPASSADLPGVTTQVTWLDGVLELQGSAPLHDVGVARAEVVLVGRRTGVVRVQPVDAFTVSGDDEDTEPGLLWTARISLGTANDAQDELDVWLQVHPSATDDEEADSAPSPERSSLIGRVAAAGDGELDAPAVVDGMLVSVRSGSDGLVVDIGATGRSLLGRLDPRWTTVVEDTSGSLLTVELPELAHHGTAVVDGALVLEGVPQPARLVVDERPRVECRLISSPGHAALRWRFGPGPAADTGCEVVTSATGELVVATLQPTRARRVPRAPRAGTTSSARPVQARAKGPVAALRRTLPRGVDPVVTKLSRLPVLRGAYRRATGLR